MSYYKCKNISIDKKKNRIRITIADSSLRPLSFSTIDLGSENDCFETKCRCLFNNLFSANIQCYPSVKKGLFTRAQTYWLKFLETKYGMSLHDLWELQYEINRGNGQDNIESFIQIKAECYENWKQFLGI